MTGITKKMLCAALSALFVLCPVLSARAEELAVGEVRTPYETDLDGDGVAETVAVLDVDYETEGSYMGIEVKKGQERCRKVTDIIGPARLFLDDVDGDGLPELIFSGDECSDDYITYCWKYTGGKLVPIPFETGEVLGGGVAGAHEGVLDTFTTVNALGTYTGYMQIRCEGGVLVNTEEDWLIARPEYYVPELTVKQDIYVLVNGGDEGDFGEEALLEAGTRIYLERTDGKSYVTFRTDGDMAGTILLEEDDWGSYTFVNGMPEEEVFEGIEYAD